MTHTLPTSAPRRAATRTASRTPWVTAVNALIEFALTAILLFVIVSAIWWVIHGPAADGTTGLRAKLAIVALVVAVTMCAVILSPWGRRSGAHANPAVSVAMWLMGAFPGAAVPAYLLAQLAGSVAGTGIARLLWGRQAGADPVDYGLARPAPGWTWWQISLSEAGCVFLVILMIGFLLSRPDQRARTLLPYVLSAAVVVIIVWLGPLSGGSGNPARQFGPALFAGPDTMLACYLIAPMAGAVAAAGVHRLLVRRHLHTHHLCGTATTGLLDPT